MYLQGFWPKSVYLKCFGNQLKTVYPQGPHSSRPFKEKLSFHHIVQKMPNVTEDKSAVDELRPEEPIL